MMEMNDVSREQQGERTDLGLIHSEFHAQFVFSADVSSNKMQTCPLDSSRKPASAGFHCYFTAVSLTASCLQTLQCCQAERGAEGFLCPEVWPASVMHTFEV